MKEQAVPPTGPAGPGGSTAQRRRQDDWRSRRNPIAPTAPTFLANRIMELMSQAIQRQVDQEGMQPSAARDARVTELTLLAVQAQTVHEFGALHGAAHGDQAARGDQLARVRGQGGPLRVRGSRYDRGGSGRGRSRGAYRDTYRVAHRGAHRVAHRAANRAAHRGAHRGHAVHGTAAGDANQQNLVAREVVPEPVVNAESNWWAAPQTGLEEIEDPNAP